MALVNLVCKVSEVNGVETWVFRHESAELGVRRTEMPFQAEAGVTTRTQMVDDRQSRWIHKS